MNYNIKRSTPRHIITERSKDKEGILKAAIENQLVTFTGPSIRLTFDFLSETMEARRQWGGVFSVLKEKKVNQGSYIWQNSLQK